LRRSLSPSIFADVKIIADADAPRKEDAESKRPPIGALDAQFLRLKASFRYAATAAD
jgi:hypothetical protein